MSQSSGKIRRENAMLCQWTWTNQLTSMLQTRADQHSTKGYGPGFRRLRDLFAEPASSSAISDAGFAALNRKPCTLEVAGLAGASPIAASDATPSSDMEKITSSGLCWVACSLT